MVAWNRCDDLHAMLDTLARQTYPLDRVHLVIVDNASTDSTLAMVLDRYTPDRIIDNDTDQASRPAFVESHAPRAPRDAHSFRSITLVRNTTNLGGCGGYNTALAYAQHALDPDDAGEPIAYAWLHDDDELLAPDALDQLVQTAQRDERIALVGSRMVDPADHDLTVETTVFFSRTTGLFAASPDDDHPLAGAHQRWLEQVIEPTGRSTYTGDQDCDLCAATSLLARWNAVGRVGFWDDRFFLASDDADWCLRFGAAGLRVVCCLDAVVYHLPWSTKRTPARDYYRRRNMVWLWRKALDRSHLRPLVRARMRQLIAQAWRQGWTRRLDHARIVRRTAADAIASKGGPLDIPQQPPKPLTDLLAQLARPDRPVHLALVCPSRKAWRVSRRVRAELTAHAPSPIRWTELIRSDLPAAASSPVPDQTRRIVYSQSLRSRLRRQLPLLIDRPDLVIVIDHHCDLPLIAGRWTAHIQADDPTCGVLVRDGLGRQLRFACQVLWTAARAMVFARTVRPRAHKGLFNT